MLLTLLPCAAQEHDMGSMPGMQHDMAGMQHDDDGMNKAGMYLMEQASGTSMNPKSWTMPMVMFSAGGWHFMSMAQAFLVDVQQSGDRGGDKFYSANWGMLSAMHNVGKGSFLVEAMLSLEPATITNRRYPELFQTGETAYGRPIVDGQHPHDLFMGLGVHYARPVGESTMLQFYFAPVGDPALGPVAFPHRASAMEFPQAVLGHHWQDSTHIANEVATAAVMFYDKVRVEVSGFHGQEPNENRWNIDYGAMDSWSARFSVFPTKNWMAQVSRGRIQRPEVLEPGDVVRTTASLHYTRPLATGDWSSSFVWGRNHKTASGGYDSDSFLGETVFPLTKRNILTARIEAVDKDELFPNGPDLAGLAFRIGAYTVGYTRDFPLIKGAQTGIGANFTAYSLPSQIKPFYGDHPVAASVFLRIRLMAR